MDGAKHDTEAAGVAELRFRGAVGERSAQE